MTYPHGLNMGSLNYFTPTPTIDQVDAAMIIPSAGKLTINVPLESEVHNWTLIASPDVTMVRLPTLNITLRGSGTFTFDAAGTPGHGTQIALSTPTPDQTLVQLIRTDHLDAFNAGEKFSPDAIEGIMGASCLRFMDWCLTNFSEPTVPLSGWTPATAPTYNQVAVPVEIMAALCNRIGADCWFNIPAGLPMTEARRIVDILRAALFPWLKLHVEWSNEVWNTKPQFKTGAWLKKNAMDAQAYYGTRCAELGKALLGTSGVDIILCWQWVGPAKMQKIIDTYKAAGGPWSMIGALGFAPYAWNSSSPISSFMPDNCSGLLDELEANRVAQAPHIAEWVAMGKKNGVPVVRYEEALSPFAATGNDAELALCIKALQDDRAGTIMRKLWADCDAAGVWFGCFYNSVQSGVFGFAPDYSSDGTPQRREWLRYNRRAWPQVRAR
jgi:hypothetical protein